MASTPKKEEPKVVIEPVNIDEIPNLKEAIAHFKQESIDGMWTEATHPFVVRGPNYLKDKVKVQSPDPVFRIIHCELITTADKKCTFFLESRMNLVSTLAQTALPDIPQPFFFVLHIQVPGTPMLSLMVYWILDITRNPDPKYIAFLEKFVTGDQKYRDSRFKIIPNILEGPRGISRLVGNRPVLLGHKVTMHYFSGANFIELDIDVASSRVAKHVVGQCREYAKLIVVDLGIVLQGEKEDELPEQLLATIQFKNMDMKQWIPREILPGINPSDEVVVEGNPGTPNQAPADFDESLEDGDIGNADTDDEPISGPPDVKESLSP